MHILEKTHRNFRKTFDFIRMEFTCVCYAEINSEKINGREKKDAKCKNCNNLYNLSNKDDVIVGKWCPKINDSPHLDMERNCEHYKAMTNADRIRNMTDEELAKWFDAVTKDILGGSTWDKKGWLKWLRAESEG